MTGVWHEMIARDFALRVKKKSGEGDEAVDLSDEMGSIISNRPELETYGARTELGRRPEAPRKTMDQRPW